MEPNKTFSETEQRVSSNIRMIRARDRVTLRDLSERTGISVPTLSRIDSGQRRIDMNQLIRIADALGVELRALLEGVI